MEIAHPRGLLCVLVIFALCGAVTGCACWQCPPKQPEPGPTAPEPPVHTLAVIEVEDAIEAALLEQELGLEPVTIRDARFVYYHPDAELDRKLAELGYVPAQVDAAQVLQRVMRIDRTARADEAPLREAGATLILREEQYWVVRGTYQQLQVLARLGYRLSELREPELRPRQVRVIVATFDQIGEVARAGVDIYTAGPLSELEGYKTTDPQAGYVVFGAAFDDAIDRLRERDFEVKVLPGTPEVQ